MRTAGDCGKADAPRMSMHDRPQECRHEDDIWLEEAGERRWRVRCLVCWTLGPAREDPKEAVRALMKRED